MDKTVIEIMTKAIFDSQVKSAREEIDRVGVGLSDAEQFFLGLRGETDAALVVLIASYIDANLGSGPIKFVVP